MGKLASLVAFFFKVRVPIGMAEIADKLFDIDSQKAATPERQGERFRSPRRTDGTASSTNIPPFPVQNDPEELTRKLVEAVLLSKGDALPKETKANIRVLS